MSLTMRWFSWSNGFLIWHSTLFFKTVAEMFSCTYRMPTIFSKCEPKPPIEPSSTVRRNSCSLPNSFMRSVSKGLQNLASATVTEMSSGLSICAACKHCWTTEPYPKIATLLPCLRILPFPIYIIKNFHLITYLFSILYGTMKHVL